MTRTTLSSELDCLDFVEGCLFMGTGGGGSPEEGIATFRAALADGLDLGWVDVDSIDDSALTITAYASGSIAPNDAGRSKLIASLRLGEPQRFQDAMAQAVAALEDHLDQRVGAIVPVELGASNSPGPIVAAAQLGIAVPDGDYSGRAVPDEMQGTPFIHGIPSHPFTSVDSWGNVAIVTTTANPYMLERVSKFLSIAGIDGTSIASTPISGHDMKRIIVPGTLTRSLMIGRATRLARQDGDDPVAAATEAAGGWRLFDGVVVHKDWEDRDGYMFGNLHIEGQRQGDTATSVLKVWFKNENHVTWLNDEPWVCSPDLVTIANAATGRGYTSTEIDVGDRVAIIGMKGLDVFRTDDALQNAFGPAYFDFADITYRPIEDLL